MIGMPEGKSSEKKFHNKSAKIQFNQKFDKTIMKSRNQYNSLLSRQKVKK
jgi:hypothetical protein